VKEENNMGDKNIKKEKRTPKASSKASTKAPRPVMPQPELIPKKKKPL
jgi:hypothetical protein